MSDPSILSQQSSPGYRAVLAAVSSFPSTSVLRTSTIIRRAREIAPSCAETDEQLLRHLVGVASGRTFALFFDGKRAQPGPQRPRVAAPPEEIRTQALRARRAVEAILDRQRHRMIAEAGEQ